MISQTLKVTILHKMQLLLAKLDEYESSHGDTYPSYTYRITGDPRGDSTYTIYDVINWITICRENPEIQRWGYAMVIANLMWEDLHK